MNSKLAAAIAGFLVVTILLAVIYRCPSSDDDITHYLMARHAIDHPHLLLNIWGRPGFTIPFFLPAQFGRAAAVAFSILIAIVGGLGAARAVRSLGERAATIAFVFTVFQTHALTLAVGTMTETVYAAALAWALALMNEGRLRTAALFFSWGAVTRLEGMPLLFVPAIVLLRHASVTVGVERRKAVAAVLCLGIFPILWNAALWAQSGFTEPLALLSRNRFLDSPRSYYGEGQWWTFIAQSFDIHGPIVAILATVGAVRLLREGRAICPLMFIAFYVLQSVLWAFGLFATGGYGRFFAAIAPAAAILAVHGLFGIAAAIANKKSRRRLVAACVTLTFVYGTVRSAFHFHEVAPLYRAVEKAVDAAAKTSRHDPWVARSPWVEYRLGLDPWDRATSSAFERRSIAEAVPGTVVIYTSHRPELDPCEVHLLDFYPMSESARLAATIAAGKNFAHRLGDPLPEWHEIADCSLYRRFGESYDDEPYPYVVKVFRRTESAVVGGRKLGESETQLKISAR